MKNLTRVVVAGMAMALGAVTSAHASEIDLGGAGTCLGLGQFGTYAYNPNINLTLPNINCAPIPIPYDGVDRTLVMRVDAENGSISCQVSATDDSGNTLFTSSVSTSTMGVQNLVNSLAIPANVFFVSVSGCTVPGKAASNTPTNKILGFEIF